MRLKTWQKWGIAFGGLHLLIFLLYIVLALIIQKGGVIEEGGSAGFILGWLLILETPAIYIYKTMKGTFYGNPYLYFFVAGTLFYSLIGIIFGLILHFIKRGMVYSWKR